jgi:hypothetical protein
MTRYLTQLTDWQQDLAFRWAAFQAWDRAAFWALLAEQGMVPIRTRSFVDTWLDMTLLGPGAPELAPNQEARTLVREREGLLKGERSRFKSQRHRELWSGAAGTSQLDYRWPVASRIANDIIRGLGRG